MSPMRQQARVRVRATIGIGLRPETVPSRGNAMRYNGTAKGSHDSSRFHGDPIVLSWTLSCCYDALSIM